MMFPFFATNRSLNDLSDKLYNRHMETDKMSCKTRTMFSDLEQKFLVLEGRVNKLEPNKSQRKRKVFYTFEQWRRMSHKRRAKVIVQTSPKEQDKIDNYERRIRHD